MRLSHIRRTIVLAAVVSGTALAAVGPAAAHTAVDDANQYGEWTADVERPAGHYRSRYQLKLGEAGNLLAEAPAAERGVAV
jgi:hypothetical protein